MTRSNPNIVYLRANEQQDANDDELKDDGNNEAIPQTALALPSSALAELRPTPRPQ